MKDEQVKPRATVTERMLLLLDHAYEAAESAEGYDDLLIGADNFFFPSAAQNGPANDVLDGSAEPEILSRHVDRIQRLIDQDEMVRAGDAQPLATARLASLIISADGETVLGNHVASTLFGLKFPVSIDALPVDEAFIEKIAETLLSLRCGEMEGSRVLSFRLQRQSGILLAKCTKLQSQATDGTLRRGLSLTVSHVNWDAGSLAFAQHEFELTPAETALLHEMLRGASQTDAAQIFGKSRETVKAQAKSILRKFGLGQMADVLNVVNTYAFMANTDRSDLKAPVSSSEERMQAGGIFVSRDGRDIQINRFGCNGGNPVLMFHGLYQGPFFSARMDAAFKAAGLDVVSPSRPGFGRTSAPRNWRDFNQVVTDDVLEVCASLGWDDVHFLVHQAGISFACRAAGEMKGRVKSATMVGAGVPIKDHMMATMNLETRVAAAASRYAPTMFDLLLRLGIAHWRRAGAAAYLKHYFGPRAVEWKTINDPEMGPLMEQGILHMIAQGTKTIIHDGESAMSDWEQLYDNLHCPQVWLHGDQDPVMNHRFVGEFLAKKSQDNPVIIQGTGGNILYAAFDQIVETLTQISTRV